MATNRKRLPRSRQVALLPAVVKHYLLTGEYDRQLGEEDYLTWRYFTPFEDQQKVWLTNRDLLIAEFKLLHPRKLPYGCQRYDG